MDNMKIDMIMNHLENLKIKMSSEEFANFVDENEFSLQDLDAISKVFDFLAKRKDEASIQMMLKLSKLPLKSPKTFANFNFEEVQGKNADLLKGLQSLSTLYSHRNVALIGPAGTGKMTPLKNPTTPEFTDHTKKRKIPGEVHLCLIDRTN